MRLGVRGTFSDGLSTKVLPQAMAKGYIQSGTIAGKLKGVMPAQTPMGCRTVLQSIPAATSLSESPIIRLGMPHATSTIWMVRRTSILRIVGGLAVLARENGGDFGGVFFEQRLEAIERLDAIDHGDVAPFEEGLVRASNGAVNIGFGCVGNLCQSFAGGRVE